MNKTSALAASVIALMLSACANTPADTSSKSSASNAGMATPAKPAGDATSGGAGSTVQRSALPAHLDPNSPLSQQHSVFFAFDEAIVGQQYTSLIEQHGKYLASMPSMKVKIEGNADERGSAEYNLALGQKRAEATLRALKIWGVRESQMEPVSWGEEHPQDKGHDESAYSHNRRADIVYPKP